jgi:hypothetical protein
MLTPRKPRKPYGPRPRASRGSPNPPRYLAPKQLELPREKAAGNFIKWNIGDKEFLHIGIN